MEKRLASYDPGKGGLIGEVQVIDNQGVGGSGNAPWVGAKQSGFGFHGLPDGHRQFAQVRVVRSYKRSISSGLNIFIRTRKTYVFLALWFHVYYDQKRP